MDDRHDIVLAETPEGCVVYVDGTDLVVEGCNLVVRNGMGSTSTTNGTGNLVVGYDEVTRWDDKSGSHNVVVGSGHDYPSYAGLVAGYDNSIEGAYSTVSGGLGNRASESYSAVSGGGHNDATGFAGAVCGGLLNEASGTYAAVSAGLSNDATAPYSAVSGGSSNSADGDFLAPLMATS